MLKKVISTGYAMMMVLVLGICLFGSDIEYSMKRQIVCPESVLFVGGILVLGLVAAGMHTLLK